LLFWNKISHLIIINKNKIFLKIDRQILIQITFFIKYFSFIIIVIMANEIKFIKSNELKNLIKDKTKIAGKDYLIIDVRDEDYVVIFL
jgi:hypothetical protein